MKLLLIGDGHVTGDKPANRIDNYWQTVKGKLEFTFETAIKLNISTILSPGDFTDTPALSWVEFYEIQKIFRKYEGAFDLYTVFGQHDMRYRTKPNTALMAMHWGIPGFNVLDGVNVKLSHAADLYGVSFNGEIPEPEDDRNFNILIIHKMIIDHKLWSKQEEYEPSNIFLRQHKYDLIVSGDNHHPFETSTPGGRWLFNCGAMMRNKIDMVNHKPYIVVFDTETKEHEKIYIPIEPAEKVFILEKVQQEKERNKELEAFVSGLSANKEMGLKFEDNLISYMKENKVDNEISEIVLNSLKPRK